MGLREEPNNFGSWYHGKMYVDAPNGQYECAVDVSTPSGIRVQYRVLRNLDATRFAPALALSAGWHLLDRTASSGAIDYVRSPLLHRRLGCVATVASPLIDLFNRLLNAATESWTQSTVLGRGDGHSAP